MAKFSSLLWTNCVIKRNSELLKNKKDIKNHFWVAIKKQPTKINN